MKNCFVGEPIIEQIPVDQNVPKDPNAPELFPNLYEEETTFDSELGELLNGNEKIMGLDTADKTQQEGNSFYDIIFLARVPKTNSMIQLILNIEIQGAKRLKYQVATRGIYYCARMISAQKNRTFTHSDYQKIQKVYSIWICPLLSRKGNSITVYDIRQTQIYGQGNIPKEDYDKLNTIVITLDAKGLQSENELIRYLSLLTVNRMPYDKRAMELEREYHIQTDEKIRKDINDMCNYSDIIYELGQEAGEEKAKKQVEEAEKKAEEAKRDKEAAEKRAEEAKRDKEEAEKRAEEAKRAKEAAEKLAAQLLQKNGMSVQSISDAMTLDLSQVKKMLQDTPEPVTT
ncbi:MAG: hypothetical protein IJ088_13405 [Clostridia bacterium]|nr:hypothetical protein [Clostridia bacterium]